MPASLQKSTGTSGSILLVEGYDALAIAFGSALKQFAPRYETRVVRSLEDAGAVLSQLRPKLVVLDCDPPPPGAVKFFDELRTVVPSTRILIVAAENADEFSGEAAPLTPLHFIKKPFELAKFGAIVQALLAPANGRRRKTARDLRLIDMLLFYTIAGPTTVLRVEGSGGRTGEIHFADGRIVHTAAPGGVGVEALQTLLRWRSPQFTEAERPTDAPRTISGSSSLVLREAMQSTKSDEPPAREERVEEAPAGSLPAKKIVIIDDTELLLIFIGEVLASAHERIEIATASSGSEGLARVAMTRPNLILLDYSLPDFSGDVVCERLLASEETARIPVIMMSGHIAELAVAAQRFNNVVATIAKPFLSAALVALVEQTLRDVTEVPLREVPTISVPEGAIPASSNGTIARENSQTSIGEQPEEEEAVPAVLPAIAEHVQAPEIRPADKLVAALSELQPVTAETPPEIPAALRGAQTNSVVLGLPLEVIALRLSAQLRVTEIRARPVVAPISLRVLPRALAEPAAVPHTRFQLRAIELKRNGGIGIVRAAPARDVTNVVHRYHQTIDGVTLLAASGSEAIELTPTLIAPMRFELLALFELSGVELTPSFAVEHLVLTAREDRMRATLLPEAAHFGATFIAADVRLDSAAMLAEIRLVAV